jgi:polyhydroxyalkanoate synthesis regulator phasin
MTNDYERLMNAAKTLVETGDKIKDQAVEVSAVLVELRQMAQHIREHADRQLKSQVEVLTADHGTFIEAMEGLQSQLTSAINKIAGVPTVEVVGTAEGTRPTEDENHG